MIAKGQFATIVAASTLALGLALSSSGAASAVEPAGSSADAPAVNPAPQNDPVTVTVDENGTEVRVSTLARTVGALLEERNDRPAAGDSVVPALEEPLVSGMRVTFHQAVPVEIHVGRATYSVQSAAATVGALLAEQHVALSPNDDVWPRTAQPLGPGAVVRVVRVRRWTTHVRQAIAPAVRSHPDERLAAGTTRVISRGKAGMREVTVRFVKRDDGRPVSTVLATRILRAPSAKIVVRGSRAYRSFAHVAEQGIASALHFAGSALHMLASAYTAGCYGCTGMTASGLRAGFGVIAVDPSIIPLGTKLFIPGYGRAVAGDTGGAIHGHRIDLGFDSYGQATQWGSRAVTVYLLR